MIPQPRPLAPGAPDSPLDLWVALATALLVLIAAAWFARRRSRLPGGEQAPRFLRIFFSAAVFGAAVALRLGIDEAFETGPVLRIVPLMAVAAAVVAIIGLVLFAIADFWLGLFRPSRERRWLAGAILTFMAIVTAALAIPYWISGLPLGWVRPELLPIVIFAAAAALVWWSYLPPPRRDVARLFE
jgi:hypothetical protein